MLHRTGGMRIPQLDELLEIAADGSFRLWRSVSNATTARSPVGSFAGELERDRLGGLENAAARAAGDGSRSWLVVPDSPVDRLEVDGAAATLGMRDPGDGAWAGLAALLRPMLDSLTTYPAAAIDLELDGGAALVHRGVEALELDLTALTVEARHIRDGSIEAEWSAPAIDAGEVMAGPGWRLELPYSHGFDVRENDECTFSTTFAARRGDRMIPVLLKSS